MKFKVWLEELRMPFLTASVVPVLLGTSIAWYHQGSISWVYFILALSGSIFMHLGTNVANDYFDHKSGNDEMNTEFVRPFTGGSRIIQKGLLSPKEVLKGSLLFFAIGSLIGLYLAYKCGWEILLIGLIGVFSGYFYTAPPVRLCSRGIGEIFVGLNFGFLITTGAYFVQTKKFNIEPLLISLTLALLIALVLYINEFQDVNADKMVGKNTLVVRLGKEKSAKVYVGVLAGNYLLVLILTATKITTPFTLLSLLTLPFAIKAVTTVLKYHTDNKKLVPANAATIMIHMLTGLLITAGYILHKILLV